MSKKLPILMTVGFMLLLRSQDTSAFLPRGPINLSVEIVVNGVDDAPRSGCRVSERIENYQRQDWRVAVGEVVSDSEAGWKGVSHGIRCDGDPSESPRSGADRATTSPFFIATGSTIARLINQMEDEKVLAVQIALSLRTLTGFGQEGEPLYRVSQLKREFFFSDDSDLFVPLLVANDTETEAVGIHELFIKIAATMDEETARAIYGVVSISSDLPDAEILLDGGVAGKIAANGEAILRNVAVGRRDLRARGSDGRKVRKIVRVRANRTVPVELNFSQPKGAAARFRLVPLGKNSAGAEEYRREIDGTVVVRIPAGEFLMGNKETERTPLEHQVYVSEFLMDKTGVTWGQFERFAAATGIPLPPHEPYWGIHDDHPMVYVTWDEAQGYCEWTGGRLPTEAEREKAARGTDGRKYPWGNEEPERDRGVFRHTWGYEATEAVGTHPAGSSPYGLQDMGGNVWEWCADWYDGGYYEVSPFRDPKGPASGNAHVVRGGSWDSRPTVLSASCRSWGHRGYRDGDFGFRCAMNAP